MGSDPQTSEIEVTLWDSAQSQVEIQSFLADVKDSGSWVVAYDAGKYTLRVGTYIMKLEVLPADGFDVVLSHRWNPCLTTTRGPVPEPMLQTSYPTPTWVDFLNQFNIKKFAGRVVFGMGELYATKKCRAIYFETKEEQGGVLSIVAATRC